jgi:Trypsin-co-occurring domain 1
MTNVQKLIMKGGEGEDYVIYIAPTEEINIVEGDSRSRGTSSASASVIDINEVHKSIRGCAKYAIDAFRSLDMPEVEKVTLKFNLKIAGKTGIPMLMEGSTESNFEIQIECKFADKQKLAE